MPYQTWIVDALKREGVRVETVAGWQTRGNPNFNPRGTVCHWTAGPRGTRGRPSLNVVTNGRPGLPGPLCQVYLDRNGVAVVVAAGRANHAGSGGYRGMVGNSSVFGIEAECGGDGDWTAAQRREYPKVVAALQRGMGRDASTVCGHNEWTTRKIDIRDWPMSRMRTDVAAILAGGQPSTPTPPPAQEEEDMPITRADAQLIAEELLNKTEFQAVGNHDIPKETVGQRLRRIAIYAKNASDSVRIGKPGVHTDGELTGIVKRTPSNIRQHVSQTVGNIDVSVKADPEAFADAVLDALPGDLAGQVVDILGKRISKKGA